MRRVTRRAALRFPASSAIARTARPISSSNTPRNRARPSSERRRLRRSGGSDKGPPRAKTAGTGHDTRRGLASVAALANPLGTMTDWYGGSGHGEVARARRIVLDRLPLIDLLQQCRDHVGL